MKIPWGYLIGGAVLGYVGASFVAAKVVQSQIVPNAFALGQQNPNMTYAQFQQHPELVAQLSAFPPLNSGTLTTATTAAPATTAAANAVTNVTGASGFTSRMLVRG